MFSMKFVFWIFSPQNLQNLGVFQQPSKCFSNYWLGALPGSGKYPSQLLTRVVRRRSLSGALAVADIGDAAGVMSPSLATLSHP
jgi:hypothetical protein